MSAIVSLARGMLLCALVCVLTGLSMPRAVARNTGALYAGQDVRIGRGVAHTVVRADSRGKVVAVGVVFTSGTLSGLPHAIGTHSTFAYALPMPTRGPRTVFDHVAMDWESLGHPPAHVYDVPHFDFHFYMVSRSTQEGIRFKSEADSGSPQQQPPADLMPTGYIMPPGTAVSRMGAHAVNPAGPEFHGRPFTATFLYGYYARRLIFLEPMVSVAFLRSKPDSTLPVTRPYAYSFPGDYPAAYSVKYDAAGGNYAVTLEDLQPAQHIAGR